MLRPGALLDKSLRVAWRLNSKRVNCLPVGGSLNYHIFRWDMIPMAQEGHGEALTTWPSPPRRDTVNSNANAIFHEIIYECIRILSDKINIFFFNSAEKCIKIIQWWRLHEQHWCRCYLSDNKSAPSTTEAYRCIAPQVPCNLFTVNTQDITTI